jgi:hypothetical protein
MHAMGRLRSTRTFPPAALLAAVLLVAWTLALAPHLVHHLLDDDAQHPPCPYLALGDHTPQLVADAPSLPLPAPVALAAPVTAGSAPRVSSRFGGDPRAPPDSTFSLRSATI